MIRRLLVVAAFASLTITASQAQRQQTQQQPSSSTEISIYVVYDDSNAGSQMCHVQLQTGTRMPISDSFTNDRGQVTFHVGAGSYRVVATIAGAEPNEVSFVVNPREAMHQEYIRLKRLAPAGGNSKDGSISSATLNIPDKAGKEFDKGVAASGKQDLDGAKQHFQKAVEIYPQYGMAFVNLGVVSIQGGNVPDGEKYFEQAIKVD